MLLGVVIAVVLLGIALLTIVLRRDLIFKLLGIGLLDSSVVLILVSLDYSTGGIAPIVRGPGTAVYVDPLPQALVLSAIVIDFAILALALVFTMLLVERYHTTDAARIETEVRKERAP